MTSFYEVVIKLPCDLESDLPKASDAFVNWIFGQELELPDWSDLNSELIEAHYVTLGTRILRVFCEFWNACAKQKDAAFFCQLEKTDKSVHMHHVVETTGVKSLILGRYLSQIKDAIVSRVYRGAEPAIENWLVSVKTKNEGGANKIRGESYIPAYLLPKKQPELQWAWSNMDAYKKATLNLEERQRLVELHKAELPSVRGFEISSDGPVIKTKQSERYMALVDWLVENGITSEKQWIQENRDSYLSFNATSNSRSQIKSALDNAGKVMALTKTASDYLIGKTAPQDVSSNRVYRIFQMNGYDPAYAGNVILGWCQRKFNKRNSIWLFGPATTGKTNIAEAIAHTVPFYGCVNWTNENFPFNDCVDKMVIWWEEGKMTAKVVESAKAILGGSKVRVDQKCKSSQQIDPTPVIITSNTNMCCVVDGNSTTFEHQQPLEDRMFKFELCVRLPHDFGKITKQEIKDFLAWSRENPREVAHEFLVAKTGSKRGGESSEDKRPSKRAKVSDDRETSESADESLNFATRYVNKCSKHLGMDVMVFPCKICHRMNETNNICFTHGKSDCEMCFPSDVSNVNWTKRYSERCDAHSYGVEVEGPCKECEYLNRNNCMCFEHKRTSCVDCHGTEPWNVDLDDCNKEQ